MKKHNSKHKITKKAQQLKAKRSLGNEVPKIDVRSINFLKITPVPLVQSDLALIYKILQKACGDPFDEDKKDHYKYFIAYYSPFFSKLFPYANGQVEPTAEPVADIASKLCPYERDYSEILTLKLFQWLDLDDAIDDLIASTDPNEASLGLKLKSLLDYAVDQSVVPIKDYEELLYDVAELRFY